VDYSAFVTLAKDLITDFGTTVTIRRVTAGSSYDPITDTTTGSTTSTYTANAVFLPLITSRPTELDAALADGAALVGDHAKLYLPAKDASGNALGFAPRPNDVVIFGTPGSADENWWNVDSVGGMEPDRTPIYYILLLTRGFIPQAYYS
jgi:hypothetical protein